MAKHLERTKINMYRMLYRFLKENGIFNNYIKNIVRRHGSKQNSKEVLQTLVEQYLDTYGYPTSNACPNLFNWAPSSFYWNDSIEGATFWGKCHLKWDNFYIKHKEEYNFA
jgi:hypothetical protein